MVAAGWWLFDGTGFRQPEILASLFPSSTVATNPNDNPDETSNNSVNDETSIAASTSVTNALNASEPLSSTAQNDSVSSPPAAQSPGQETGADETSADGRDEQTVALAQADLNATATAEWLPQDDDRDGLTNEYEVENNLLPDNRDTDTDGISDGDEIDIYFTNPLVDDSDRDGWADGLEIERGTDPLNEDTDGDALLDNVDPNPRASEPPTEVPTPTPNLQATATQEARATSTAEALKTREVRIARTREAEAQATQDAIATQSAFNDAAATATAIARSATATAENLVTPTRVIEEATPTTAPRPINTPVPQGPGLITGFESVGQWRLGDEKWATITASNEKAQNGLAARIQYDFSTAQPNNDYVIFLNTPAQPLEADVSGLQMYVYGDGSGNFLNAWIEDSAGQVWAFSFGQIYHTGWRLMTASFNPGLGWPNGIAFNDKGSGLTYPLRLYALALDGEPRQTLKGIIYLDDLSSN
jgi:hypothetical protein